MKKLFVSSAVALALTSGALVAEESGAFVGVGLGTSELKEKIVIFPDDVSDTASGLNYELLIGYKTFFAPNFGVRLFANLSGTSIRNVNLLNYGVNIDMLYNFITNEYSDFGAFVGLNLGGYSWSGDEIDAAESIIGLYGQKITKNSLGFAINLGVRTEIAKHHGFEFATKIPLTETTLISAGGFKATMRQNYSIGLRYIYSFSI